MTIPTYTSGVLFTRAHKIVRARIYSLLEKYELNPTYWSILGATMQAGEGIRLAKVAEIVGVKAPLITVMAGELADKGLIRRVPHHSDKRAKLLVLTPKGKKLSLQIESELNQEIRQLMEGVSSSEAAAFQKTLETIIRNAS